MCETYNGWANRATCLLYEWLMANPEVAEHWSGMASRAREEIAKQPTAGMNVEDWARDILASKLNSHFENAKPSVDAAGPWDELVGWGLERVDWDQIAQSLLVN